MIDESDEFEKIADFLENISGEDRTFLVFPYYDSRLHNLEDVHTSFFFACSFSKQIRCIKERKQNG